MNTRNSKSERPRDPRRRGGRRGRGVAMIWVLVAFAVLTGFCSLAVDLGRVQLAKSQLRAAADAAAMYALQGLKTSVTAAQDKAIAAANDNATEGSAVVLDRANDIEFGLWDPGAKTFAPLSGSARLGATAVRVTARRVASRGTAVSTPFAGVLGSRSADVTVSSIAVIGKGFNLTIPATGCPWLAGAPNGTHIAGQGQGVKAPANSPIQVTQLTVKPGDKINFRDVAGSTGDTTTGLTYGLDGNLSRTQIRQTAANGINSTTAPLNALVGIFLNDNAPSTTPMAAAPDFSTAASRDFSSLSPALKQVFFIGDGINASDYLQDFVVPPGATRLYLGVMDENAFWWDNVGSITTTVFNGHAMLVK